MEFCIKFFVVLSCLVLGTLGVAKDGKFYCSSLKPIKNIPMIQLEGNWITLNELLFKDGLPAGPSQGESIRHNQCIRHEVGVVNKTSQAQLTWAPFFSFLRGHESKGAPFTIASRANGRWRLQDTNGKTLQGGRMLLLAGEIDTYIVRAVCFPEKRGQGRSPLVLKTVSVESRREPGQEGRGALDAEQLLKVKGKVAKLLGLSEFRPAQFGLFC